MSHTYDCGQKKNRNTKLHYLERTRLRVLGEDCIKISLVFTASCEMAMPMRGGARVLLYLFIQDGACLKVAGHSRPSRMGETTRSR